MKIKEFHKKLRTNPKYLQAEHEMQWDIFFEASRAVFQILMRAELTQKELAKKAGILQSSISRAENYGCNLTLLNKLAKAAGFKLEIKVKKANPQSQEK